MPRLLTTVPHEFAALNPARLAWWRERAEVLDRREHSRLGYVAAAVRAADRYEAVLLDGSIGARELYSDLIVAGAIRRRTGRIVISDATWKRGGPLDTAAMTLGLRAIDSPRTIYCVLSRAELESFPRTWRVDPARVVFTPFCCTLTEEELAEPVSEDGGVFAGGDSMRDHGLLLEAAAGLGVRVRVASATLDPARAPANVTVARVEHGEFNRLLRAAALVVVPLRAAERSGGQQTYLNAMALGKLVVVTDAPGVRDHVEDRVTGIVVPPRADELASAIRWALDPANAAEAQGIRGRARERARSRFSLDAYFERLAAVALAT